MDTLETSTCSPGENSCSRWSNQDCHGVELADRMVPARGQRNCGLDLMRTICVLFVCVAHGPVDGDRYARWNVFDANLWVLYFLTMLSAMLLARSRAPLGPYLARLGAVFLLGVALNAAAIKVRGGKVWDSDYIGPSRFLAPENPLVLQMGYILCIQVFGSYFYAMRGAARYDRRLVAAFCIVSSAGLLALQIAAEPTAWPNLVRCIVVVCTSGYIIRAGISGEVNRRTALAASISVIAFVVPLEVWGWSEFIHKDHLVGPKGCNMLTFYAWGFAWGLVKDHINAEAAKRAANTYWPVALPWLLTASVPLRVDLESPKDPWQRLAVLASWLTFALGFALYSCTNLEDFLGIAGPLNIWSLVWYCGHMLFGALFDGPWYYFVLSITYAGSIGFGMRRTLWPALFSRSQPASQGGTPIQRPSECA